jgi:hypothetical protein
MKRLVSSLFLLSLALTAMSAVPEDAPGALNSETFSGLEWRGIGPALMSGRIAAIVIDPVVFQY